MSGSMTVASTSTAAKEPAMNATNLKGKKKTVNLCFQRTSQGEICVPHDDGYLFIWELANIHAGERVTLVKPPFEYMG